MARRRSESSWGTVRLRVTVAATVLVGVAMLLASVLLVASVRSSLRESERSQSRLVVDHALQELQERSRVGVPINLRPYEGRQDGGGTERKFDGERSFKKKSFDR